MESKIGEYTMILDMCPDCNRHIKWINKRSPKGDVKCPLCKSSFSIVFEDVLN
jgi:endogenous inhibitor of DNA gyrase (YacG/DUF329 family)|tara:strand:- start:227 stop:385 length:159 start_codon:yes stop_codon:yes gene_type:complete